jgi:hypothetical protein
MPVLNFRNKKVNYISLVCLEEEHPCVHLFFYDMPLYNFSGTYVPIFRNRQTLYGFRGCPFGFLRRAVMLVSCTPLCLIIEIDKIKKNTGVMSRRGTSLYLSFFLWLAVWEKRSVVYIFWTLLYLIFETEIIVHFPGCHSKELIFVFTVFLRRVIWRNAPLYKLLDTPATSSPNERWLVFRICLSKRNNFFHHFLRCAIV